MNSPEPDKNKEGKFSLKECQLINGLVKERHGIKIYFPKNKKSYIK
jgi:hypothetical protein